MLQLILSNEFRQFRIVHHLFEETANFQQPDMASLKNIESVYLRKGNLGEKT